MRASMRLGRVVDLDYSAWCARSGRYSELLDVLIYYNVGYVSVYIDWYDSDRYEGDEGGVITSNNPCDKNLMNDDEF